MRGEGGSGCNLLHSWLDSISFFPEPAHAHYQQTQLIVSHSAAGVQYCIVCACPCKLRAFLCALVPLQLSQIPLACVCLHIKAFVRPKRVCIQVSGNVFMQLTAAWRNGQ